MISTVPTAAVMPHPQQQMPENEVDGENDNTSLVKLKVPQEQAEGHLVTERERGVVESFDALKQCQVASSQQLDEYITPTINKIDASHEKHDGENATNLMASNNASSSGISHLKLLSDQEDASDLVGTIDQDDNYCSRILKSPDVIHHVDQKTKQNKLKAELEELRNKHLAKPKGEVVITGKLNSSQLSMHVLISNHFHPILYNTAARLMTAAPPGELLAFQEKQRELTHQWKQSERDARELLHKYRGDGNNLLLNTNLPNNNKRRNCRELNRGSHNDDGDDVMNDCNNNIFPNMSNTMSPSRLKPYFEEKWKKGLTTPSEVTGTPEKVKMDISVVVEENGNMVPSMNIQGASIAQISESKQPLLEAEDQVQRLVPPKCEDIEFEKDNPQVNTAHASSKVDVHRRLNPVTDYGHNEYDTKQQISDIGGNTSCGSDHSLSTVGSPDRKQISHQVQSETVLPPPERVENCVVLTPQRKPSSCTEGPPSVKVPGTPDTLLSSTTDETSLQSEIVVQGSSDAIVSNSAASRRPKPKGSKRKKKKTKDDVGFSWLSGIFVTRHIYSR